MFPMINRAVRVRVVASIFNQVARDAVRHNLGIDPEYDYPPANVALMMKDAGCESATFWHHAREGMMVDGWDTV